MLYARLDPENGRARGYRLRRDHPEIEDGKPRDKYLSSVDRPALFFAPGVGPLLADITVTVAMLESEKSVLALTAGAVRSNRRLLAIGSGGCWGWRGRIGKMVDASGARVDEKGPLSDFDRIVWTGRDVVILFDTNTAMNPKVQAARRALASELTSRGAVVRLANLPIEDGINGPDDFIGRHGDAALVSIIDNAKPAGRTAQKRKVEKAKQGRDVQLVDPEPWPEPVNGAVLLDAIAGTFTRCLALPAHASTAIALWVLHAYAFKAWFTSPFSRSRRP